MRSGRHASEALGLRMGARSKGLRQNGKGRWRNASARPAYSRDMKVQLHVRGVGLVVSTVAVLGAAGAALLVACSSSPSGGNGTGSDAGGSDAGIPALSCNTYCQTIQQNCGAVAVVPEGTGDGGTGQYYDLPSCMATCALFPMGTYAESANSLGCRQYHATLAATSAVIHCPHAGAGGGALCGSRCDDYCSLVMAHCTVANGANPPYANQADCMAACNAYPYEAGSIDYDPNNIGTLNCLDYHLRESLSDLAGQGIDGGHCDDLSIDGGMTRGACHP